MRKLLTLIMTVSLTVWMAAFAAAANIDGQQYRIVSYSFSSDDPDSPSDRVTLGPLLITGSATDVLMDSPINFVDYGTADPKNATDIFALSADFSATPDISVRGAFGITKNRWNAALDPEYDSSWEANLGVIYRLFNNINYEVHFGYMETGDLFKESNAYTDVESIIMISNKLTMSF